MHTYTTSAHIFVYKGGTVRSILSTSQDQWVCERGLKGPQVFADCYSKAAAQAPYVRTFFPIVKSLSRVRLFATPWTVAYQAPPSVGFSRQECWSGLPFSSPYPVLKIGRDVDTGACRAKLGSVFSPSPLQVTEPGHAEGQGRGAALGSLQP